MAQQELRVNIKGNASGLNTALSKAQGKLKSFGSRMSAVGSSLQTKLALPLVAAGGAAIKMAYDFDKSMTQIKSLVGIAGNEVDAMGEKAKQMAIAAGKSSAEAADALFFITSAGLRGDEAMSTLAASLKAAAVGLGETKTIADLATSAMNAYGSDTLSASDATDILVAAVREGKLEASELAGAMGGVIPVASNMGVSFDEIGAAMAAMSRTGTNAANAATQLNAILASIAKPTDQSTQAFAKMGYSVDDLKSMLDKEGLMQTLINLKSGLDSTGQTFTDIVPNIRAWKGVLDLTGASVESNKQIFDALTNSVGATDKAFETTSQSASFQLATSLNKAKETLASLGQTLLTEVVPIIEKAANFVGNLYQMFMNLDGATKNIIIGVAGFLTVLPTLITLFGTLTTVVGALLSPVGLIASGLAAVAYVIYKNWNEVLPVITGLYNQFVDLYNSSEPLRIAIFGIGAAFKSVFTFAKMQIDQLINVFKTMWNVIKAFSEDGFDASFGDILKDGFDNGKEIAANGAKEIAETFSDAYGNALGSQLEHKTSEQIQAGLTSAVDGVKGFIGDISGQVGDMFSGGMFAGGAGTGALSTAISEETPKIQAALQEQSQVISQAQLDAMARAQEFNEGLGEIINTGLQDLASGIGEALGNAMANGGNLVQSLSSMLLGTLGNMAMQMGKLAIAVGLGVEGIKKALQSLNPAVAIAAGIALVALGAFAAAQAGKISEGGGGATAFADGGIVSGPTLGLVGEYAGARNNPEVIAPLDKLKNLISDQFQQPGALTEQLGGALSAFSSLPKFSNGGVVSAPTMGLMANQFGTSSSNNITPLNRMNGINGASEKSNIQVGGEIKLRGSDLIVAFDRANKNRNRLI